MKRATEHRQAIPVTSRPALSRQRATGLGRVPAYIAAGLLATLLLAACTGGSRAATGPAGAPSDVAATQPGTAESAGQGTAAIAGSGTAVPGTTSGTAGPSGRTSAEAPATAAMKQAVTDALTRLAAGTPKPATAQVTEALTGAGVAPATLEVSASRTPTGLAADAIESAVLQGTDCVFGHIRDGSVTVTVLPVLASGKCFVGAAV
ncbi:MULTISPECIES: hypothetical protein [unclassified Arthrobacter]|uniref:DUF6993 domain-containing protein n=1 Tax=unclassified Arthrobacter TaxID=235627 RepID=UPI003394EB35